MLIFDVQCKYCFDKWRSRVIIAKILNFYSGARCVGTLELWLMLDFNFNQLLKFTFINLLTDLLMPGRIYVLLAQVNIYISYYSFSFLTLFL